MLWLALLLALPLPALAAPRFSDHATALPVPHIYSGGWEHFVGGGVAVFDCNNDQRPDLFAAGGASPSHLFINRAGPARLAFDLGDIPPLDGVTGAYPLDIDSDGNVDLAVLRVGPNLLLRGDGQCGFADHSAQWGLPAQDRWTTAFTATFEAGQSWPTMVFGQYVDRANPDGPFGACDTNSLLRPLPLGGYGPEIPLDPGFCALSLLISDWQRQGTPELRISNDRHYYLRGGREQMWRLSPLAERTKDDNWPLLSIWGMGIASADLTGDGLPEVMLTSMGDQVLQLNTGGTLTNAPYKIGTYAQRPHSGEDGRPSTGWHAEFGDIDNDGRLDLFIAKGNVDQMPSNAMHDPNNLLMQTPAGDFTESSVAAGIATTDRSRGAALADFDGDGRLDIAVMNRRAAMELWLNDTPDTGNWLAINPVIPGANPNAIGAWVELRAAGRTQSRERTIGGGHAGGQLLPLHFGLGTAFSAEARVLWPDGTTSDWHPAPPNQTLTILKN